MKTVEIPHSQIEELLPQTRWVKDSEQGRPYPVYPISALATFTNISSKTIVELANQGFIRAVGVSGVATHVNLEDLLRTTRLSDSSFHQQTSERSNLRQHRRRKNTGGRPIRKLVTPFEEKYLPASVVGTTVGLSGDQIRYLSKRGVISEKEIAGQRVFNLDDARRYAEAPRPKGGRPKIDMENTQPILFKGTEFFPILYIARKVSLSDRRIRQLINHPNIRSIEVAGATVVSLEDVVTHKKTAKPGRPRKK